MAEDPVESKEVDDDTLEPPELLPPTTKEQREANWRSMTEFMGKIGDRQGTGVDKGIVEPIVGFNLLGMKTSQSCEGHLDHGSAAPWINFGAEVTDEAAVKYEEIHKIWEEIDKKGGVIASEDEVRDLHERRHKLVEELERPNLAVVKQAIGLLEEFYQDRKVPVDRQLIVSTYGDGSGRLQPQGADVQKIESPEVRAQKLAEYREEVGAFSAFLKDKYLQGTND
jgi:hypothetical protein